MIINYMRILKIAELLNSLLKIYLRVLNNKIKENYKDLHSVEVLIKQGEYTNNALVEILEKGANTKLIFNIWILNIRQTR